MGSDENIIGSVGLASAYVLILTNLTKASFRPILVRLVNPVRAMSEIVSLYDAKTHLSQLVDRAAEGEEFVIAKNGTALARLVPLVQKGKLRKPAGALGLTAISADFDDPLPEDLQALFEGKS